MKYSLGGNAVVVDSGQGHGFLNKRRYKRKIIVSPSNEKTPPPTLPYTLPPPLARTDEITLD